MGIIYNSHLAEIASHNNARVSRAAATSKATMKTTLKKAVDYSFWIASRSNFGFPLPLLRAMCQRVSAREHTGVVRSLHVLIMGMNAMVKFGLLIISLHCSFSGVESLYSGHL